MDAERDVAATLDGPLGAGTRRCPICLGIDLRVKYGDATGKRTKADLPSITYCVDCLLGTSDHGMTVDMMLFPSAAKQRDAKRAALAAEGGREP